MTDDEIEKNINRDFLLKKTPDVFCVTEILQARGTFARSFAVGFVC